MNGSINLVETGMEFLSVGDGLPILKRQTGLVCGGIEVQQSAVPSRWKVDEHDVNQSESLLATTRRGREATRDLGWSSERDSWAGNPTTDLRAIRLRVMAMTRSTVRATTVD